MLPAAARGATRLLELRHLHGVAFRAAHAAVESVIHDERPEALVFRTAENVHDERLQLRVLPAHAAAAEAAGAERGPFACPAVHTLYVAPLVTEAPSPGAFS